MRVAAIDVGTNSVRLYVADESAGVLHSFNRELIITRLGEGVDASKSLAEEPMRRTATAIETYVNRARAARAEKIRIAATSAVRDASNRDEFLQLVSELTSLNADVLSGGEEARLSFAGANSGLPTPGPVLVLDIGGGSTEFVFGESGDVHAWISLDVGSVRLTERHVTNDPPAADEIAAIRADATEAVRSAAQAIAPARARFGDAPATLVGLAGTMTTVAAIAMDLDTYDRDAIHGTTLALKEVTDVLSRLSAMTSKKRRELPAMPKGREDVIVAGVVLLEAAMSGLQFEQVTVSEADILDGLALSLI